MKRIFLNGFFAALFLITFSARGVEAQTTTENLLISTELLLISQVNLSILALNLIATNMQHEYTTVDEDRESLDTIIQSLDLSHDTIQTLLKSKDVEKADLELIRLLSRTNDSLIASSKELIDYCDDGDTVHFSNFADDMQNVVTNLEKAQKLLE